MTTNTAAAIIGAFIDHARNGHQDLVDSMPNAAENDRQRKLQAKHGTPREFAQAVVNAIGEISVDEARSAIFRYQTQWLTA